MWPRLLDMEEDDCRRVQRRLELEAYSSLISALRAQGDLSAEKKSILTTVATTLGISTERHKAEIRRAINDEKLTTIAERLGGDSSSSLEWSLEGRRLVPMLPRFIPQTMYTVTANQVANMAAAHNATLPDPSKTAKPEGSKSQSEAGRDPGATPTHIVLPQGTILPKSPPDLQALEERAKSLRVTPSSNYASNPASFLSALTSAKHAAATSSASSGSKGSGRSSASSSSNATPSSMKVTYTKAGSGTTPSTTQAGQKVVIMSSASSTDQPTLSDSRPRTQTVPTPSKVTMTTPPDGRSAKTAHPFTIQDPLTGNVTSYHHSSHHKHHRKSSKQKSSKSSHRTTVPPMSTAITSGYSMGGTVGSSAVPTVIGGSGKKVTMTQQRPEPGMKLITQTVASSSGRMTSKTYQVSASSASPTVRTTTVGMQSPRTSSAAGSLSPGLGPGVRNMVTTTGPRIVTVPSTLGGARPQSSTSNVITLSPMALQKAAGKSTTTTVVVTKAGGVGSGKTNVIVVQKSQLKSKMISSPRVTVPGLMTHTTSVLTRPKIAMTMTSYAGAGQAPPPASPGAMSLQSVRFPSPPGSVHQKSIRGPSPVGMGAAGGMMGGPVIRGRSPSPMSAKGQGMMRPKSPIAQTMATLSAEIDLQSKVKGHRRSSAVSPPGPAASTKVVVEDVPGAIARSSSLAREPSLIFQSSTKPNSEWIEYDGSPPSTQSASSAIKALLEFRGQPLPTASTVKHIPSAGASPVLPSASGVKQSPAIRRIPSALPTADSQREPSQLPPHPQAPSSVTVEVQRASAERLEFSPDQLSSVVDQFEQFLESEELEAGKQQKEGSEQRLSASSTKSGDRRGDNPNDPKADPFEFVEEIISKDSDESLASRPKANPDAPRATAQDVAATVVTKISPLVQQTSPASAAQPSQPPQPPQTSQPPQAPQPATVVMETASTFDITHMTLEDLSCQRMREEEEEEEDGDEEEKRGDDDAGSASEMASFFDTSSGGSGSEGVMSADGTVRVSRRKRKAPTPIDEETGPSSMPTWARAAWNLLQRVMRFRGANRPKGGINAASWFTRPVDPLEAPGYHKLIKKPMDFGTIKRNLEASGYQDFAEFHHDMMLVKSNCLQYNPAGHAARRDCEEVFQFYSSEYSKTLDRWQKQMLLMPKSPKRMRPDQPLLPSQTSQQPQLPQPPQLTQTPQSPQLPQPTQPIQPPAPQQPQ